MACKVIKHRNDWEQNNIKINCAFTSINSLPHQNLTFYMSFLCSLHQFNLKCVHSIRPCSVFFLASAVATFYFHRNSLNTQTLECALLTNTICVIVITATTFSNFQGTGIKIAISFSIFGMMMLLLFTAIKGSSYQTGTGLQL